MMLLLILLFLTSGESDGERPIVHFRDRIYLTLLRHTTALTAFSSPRETVAADGCVTRVERGEGFFTSSYLL